MSDARRGRGADRRSAGAQLRHDRRQRRARRSGVRPADRPARRSMPASSPSGLTGERTIPAADFFQGMMTTALGEHDILTAIEIAAAEARRRDGVREVRPSRLALRRGRRRGGGDGAGGVCSGGASRDWRAAAGATRTPGGRESAGRRDNPPRTRSRPRPSRVAEHLDGDVLEDVFASAELPQGDGGRLREARADRSASNERRSAASRIRRRARTAVRRTALRRRTRRSRCRSTSR